MKKTFLFLAILAGLFSCESKDEFSDTCITNCSSSIPGKINLVVENHTNLDISNLSMKVNGSTIQFDLFSKRKQGSYSCWVAFDEINLISGIQFNIGANSIHQELVNYENLARNREYSIDITDNSEGIMVQLVSDPGCVADAN